jgi:hypothetical protein
MSLSADFVPKKQPARLLLCKWGVDGDHVWWDGKITRRGITVYAHGERCGDVGNVRLWIDDNTQTTIGYFETHVGAAPQALAMIAAYA